MKPTSELTTLESLGSSKDFSTSCSRADAPSELMTPGWMCTESNGNGSRQLVLGLIVSGQGRDPSGHALRQSRRHPPGFEAMPLLLPAG
jgi:hypothetical protein